MLWGEGSHRERDTGVEEGIICLHCHTAPGVPRESRLSTDVARLPPTDLWGQTTTHAEWPEGLGWSAWKRPMDPGLICKSLPGLSEGGSGSSTAFMGDKGIGVGAIGGRFPPGIRKPRQSSPTMETILRGGELSISGGMQAEARIDRDMLHSKGQQTLLDSHSSALQATYSFCCMFLSVFCFVFTL